MVPVTTLRFVPVCAREFVDFNFFALFLLCSKTLVHISFLFDFRFTFAKFQLVSVHHSMACNVIVRALLLSHRCN